MRVGPAVASFALAAGLVAGCPQRPADALGLNCSIATATLNFGNYDPFSTVPISTTGSVTVTCLIATTFNVTLSQGSSNSFAARTLKNGASALSYNVYLDAAHTTVWGDGTGGTSIWTNGLSLLSATATAYGLMPAQQNVASGAYGDSIVETVNF